MTKYIYLIPLLPFIGFLINGILGKKLGKGFVTVIGTGVLLLSFIISLLSYLTFDKEKFKTTVYLFDFINTLELTIPFELLYDPLSAVMLLIITGVGMLIHIYSIGYMHDDRGYYKYFSFLNLFVFFMVLLVLGANYVIMFIGWEGVGLCSYLLIGFWNTNEEYTKAAKKAFVMNRIGDLGYIMGLFVIYITFESFSYEDIFSKAALISEPNTALTLICILLFIGATGKSAQIPLFTWLPDAMAGPTPVSALIHAATMVTAGIYMIVRSNILYSISPSAQLIISVIGIATAILGSVIALAQNDIKKVLAYSTVSQLGYMFLALGVGAYTAALFHVITHAFFKALLFLGAGSVIHATNGEQDIRRMGGLGQYLPITHYTFLIGTLAISGIPPFSGFFSKDLILSKAYQFSPFLWALGIVGAILTAFYMFRLYFLVFQGDYRGDDVQKKHLHESPLTMTVPLIILAGFSLAGGIFNLPEIINGNQYLEHFLSPIRSYISSQSDVKNHLNHAMEYILMLVSIVAALLSISFAYYTYAKRKIVPKHDGYETGLHKLVYHKFYIDQVYEGVFVKPFNNLSTFLGQIFDIKIIDGLVNNVSLGFEILADKFRKIQTGSITAYIFLMVLGLVILSLVTGILF